METPADCNRLWTLVPHTALTQGSGCRPPEVWAASVLGEEWVPFVPLGGVHKQKLEVPKLVEMSEPEEVNVVMQKDTTKCGFGWPLGPCVLFYLLFVFSSLPSSLLPSLSLSLVIVSWCWGIIQDLGSVSKCSSIELHSQLYLYFLSIATRILHFWRILS